MKENFLQRPLAQLEITVLDYECTGAVTGFPDEPWQIGMVTFRAGSVDLKSQFESFLRISPERPFNPHAPGRHARLRNELAFAPLPSEIWNTVQSRLINFPLCAHNVGTEKKQLRKMAPMHPFGPWVDTLKLARKAWPGLQSYSLEALSGILGLDASLDRIFPNRTSHDALYDAVACGLLLEHLLQEESWKGILLEEILAL
jgi:DNA polymerase-3 subunit epsilon